MINQTSKFKAKNCEPPAGPAVFRYKLASPKFIVYHLLYRLQSLVLVTTFQENRNFVKKKFAIFYQQFYTLSLFEHEKIFIKNGVHRCPINRLLDFLFLIG